MAATELIEHIVERGAQVLYNKYLDAKVPAHTHEFVFDCLASLLTVENRAPDAVKIQIEQPSEE